MDADYQQEQEAGQYERFAAQGHIESAPFPSPTLEEILHGDGRLTKYSISILLLNFTTPEYAPHLLHESLASNFRCNEWISFFQECQSHVPFNIFHYDITTVLNEPIIIVQLENVNCAGRSSSIFRWNKIIHFYQTARKIQREPTRLYEERIQYVFAFSFAIVDDGRRQPIIRPFIGKIWIF